MADYFTPTVIQPTIPVADMTLLERLLLSHVFQSEAAGDGLYFYAEQSVNDLIYVPVDNLRAALAASEAIPSQASDFVREALAEVDAESDADLEFDMSLTGWAYLFQDIVRRSSSVPYISAQTAFTCTRMRPDGFGGMAWVITAEAVKTKTTDEMIETMLAEPDYGAASAEPGLGVHCLLRLTEENVRAALPDIIETDPSISIAAEAVSDVDIRRACLAIVAATDLSEEQGKAVYDAARVAIDAAEERPRPPVAPSEGGRHEQG